MNHTPRRHSQRIIPADTVSKRTTAPQSSSSAPTLRIADLEKLVATDLSTKRVRRIRLDSPLGSGSSATVFQASSHLKSRRFFSPRRRRTYAVKIVPSRKVKEFSQELAALCHLNHANIPKLLFSASLDNQDHLMGLELGRGGCLLNIVEEAGSLSEEYAVGILQQVFAAVAYAHSRFYIHRDIKLENIVFKDASRKSILLIDWGMSTMYSASSFLHEDCGSLHYASPELLRFHPYRGPEVDAWALGVLTFTVLVGRFPFLGSSPASKLRAFRQGLSFPVAMSELAISFITRLLDPDPQRRLTPTEALSHPWLFPAPPAPSARLRWSVRLRPSASVPPPSVPPPDPRFSLVQSEPQYDLPADLFFPLAPSSSSPPPLPPHPFSSSQPVEPLIGPITLRPSPAIKPLSPVPASIKPLSPVPASIKPLSPVPALILEQPLPTTDEAARRRRRRRRSRRSSVIEPPAEAPVVVAKTTQTRSHRRRRPDQHYSSVFSASLPLADISPLSPPLGLPPLVPFPPKKKSGSLKR
jgi:serine/threonine protein kinase